METNFLVFLLTKKNCFSSRMWSFIRNTCNAAAAAWVSWPRVVLRPTSRQQFLVGGKSYRKSWKNHCKTLVSNCDLRKLQCCFTHFFHWKNDGHLKLRVRASLISHRLLTIDWCQALWMARHRAFPDAERRGLSGAGGAVVLTSVLAHYSMEKASSFVWKDPRWFMEI